MVEKNIVNDILIGPKKITKARGEILEGLGHP